MLCSQTHQGFPGGSDSEESYVTRETSVCSLGWEDPLEEGMETHSGILAWRITMDRGAWRAAVHGVAKSWTRLSDSAHGPHPQMYRWKS